MEAETRVSLSRGVIAKTALALADEHGLAGLSMRKLGNELGVEAMSLYHYVEHKSDLLDAMVDVLFREVKLPYEVPPSDWELAIREGLRAFYQVLVDHASAHELFALRPARSDDALRVLLWAHERFAAVGLDGAQAHQALHTAVSFVMGHRSFDLGVAAHQGINSSAQQPPEAVAYLESVSQFSRREMFEAGLDVVIAGIRSQFSLP